MHDITCTVVGNAVTDVRSVITRTGHHVASFRIASTLRRFDREAGRWQDVETTYLTVSCWRTLADHVVQSVHKGDPVVVTGRLRVREWSDGDRRGLTVDVDAKAVGHDLARGISRFERVRRLGPDDVAPRVPIEATGEPGAAA